MNYPKANPTGIDAPIHRMQGYLYSKLKEIWGLTDDQFNAFPRAYRNKKDDGYLPEFKYQGVDENTMEYKDLFGDDHFHAHFFFGVADNITTVDGGECEVQVHIIFWVNLEELDTTKALTHRGDAEAIADVYSILSYRKYGFTPKGWVTGLDKVFAEYPAWSKANLKNMQPWLYFRHNLTLRFDPNDCLKTPIGVITGYPCSN